MNLGGLLEHATLKLFSLGVALILFLFVAIENSTSLDVDFRIEYRTADDVMVVNAAPDLLHTTLQGPWAAFRSFEASSMEPVVIDLIHAGLGTVRQAVEVRSVHPPGGMRVLEVRPSELEIVLDRRIERQVPIHADVPEGPAFGFEIREVSVVPAKARITGPASKMQALEYVVTLPLDVSGRETDLSLDVEIRRPPAPLRLLDRHATVFVGVGEETIQRTLTEVPVHITGAPPGSTLVPEQVSLTIRGPRRVVETLEAEHLEAGVNVAAEVALGHERIEKAVAPERKLPERTQLIGQPPRVTVMVPPKKSNKRK